jgi:hypothetical protein
LAGVQKNIAQRLPMASTHLRELTQHSEQYLYTHLGYHQGIKILLAASELEMYLNHRSDYIFDIILQEILAFAMLQGEQR